MRVTRYDRIGNHIKKHLGSILFLTQSLVFAYLYYYVSYREIFLTHAKSVLTVNAFFVAVILIWSLTSIDDEDLVTQK